MPRAKTIRNKQPLQVFPLSRPTVTIDTITEPRPTYRDRYGRANPGKGAGFVRAQQRLARQREIWEKVS